MATAVGVTRTNNPEIDGLLGGTKWSGTISYSFPDSPSDYSASYYGNGEPNTSGFSSAPAAMQQAINYAIGLIASYTNASFSYAGTSGSDVAIAQSPAANPTSYAYYPANVPAGGDIWFGNAYNYSLAVLGNYYFATALHELGHALGLKHSQETGGVAGVAVPAAHDNSEYAVMSYRSYAGAPLTGYTAEYYGYSQTYMANDILALQTLYGANFSTRSENTVYTWSPTTGQTFINGVAQLAPGNGAGGSANRVFETIWDGNGVDTYDLSNYSTAVTLNLNPGASSITSNIQLAYLGNGHYAAGNIYNAYLFNGDARSYIDNAIGGAGGDTITGNVIANTLNGGGGNDRLDGGAANDTIIGGAGIDIMTGGSGADNFVFAVSSSSAASGQHDRITDFTNGVDHIDLSGIDAIGGTAGHDLFRFIGTDSFQGSAGELNYFYNSSLGVTVLQGDINGDRVADFAIDLVGNISIDSSDVIGAVQNAAPVVTTATLNLARKTTFAISTLFSVTDAENDPITAYELWDSTRDPNSGHFVVNGVAQAAGTVIRISAAELAATSFVTGTTSDALQIRAFDGVRWSASDTVAWAPFNINVPANHAPVVTTVNVSAGRNQTLAASSLLNVTDSDGDSIVAYELWDSTRGPNSGHFVVNGVAQAAGTVIHISAAELAATSFVTGSVSDALQIRAFDGAAWSASDTAAWAPFNVIPVNHAPVVTTANVSAGRNQTFAVSSLLNVTDADSDSIVAYELWDSTRDPNSGHFVVNGVVQAAGTVIHISAAELAATSFVTGTVSDALQIRASDGIGWSAGDTAAWAPFHLLV